MSKTNVVILLTLLGIALLMPQITYSEQAYKPFVAKQYNQQEYKITQRDIQHGDLTLRIIEAKKLINFTEPPHYCRAWFDVIRSKSSVFRRYFEDIMPVAFSFGLFVPKVQPPSPYFAVVKNGDYDGRLFLVRNDGKVFDLMGGFYFITQDRRYLFSQYASDIEGLVVLDLQAGKTVFSSDQLPYIHQWYVKDGTYFFTESEWLPVNLGKPTEKEGVVYLYDFNSHQIVQKNMTAATVASAKALTYDFDPREYKDCSIEPDLPLKRGTANGRRAPELGR